MHTSSQDECALNSVPWRTDVRTTMSLFHANVCSWQKVPSNLKGACALGTFPASAGRGCTKVEAFCSFSRGQFRGQGQGWGSLCLVSGRFRFLYHSCPGGAVQALVIKSRRGRAALTSILVHAPCSQPASPEARMRTASHPLARWLAVARRVAPPPRERVPSREAPRLV